MKTFQNGYGETVKQVEVGDHMLYTSSKYPDLKPYEVVITHINVAIAPGRKYFMSTTPDGGDVSSWRPESEYSELA